MRFLDLLFGSCLSLISVFLKRIGGLLEGGPRLDLAFEKKGIGRPQRRSRGVGGRPAGGGGGGGGRGWLAAELAGREGVHGPSQGRIRDFGCDIKHNHVAPSDPEIRATALGVRGLMDCLNPPSTKPETKT